MALFAKFIGKLRTKNFEAHFHRKLRTPKNAQVSKNLRTAEPIEKKRKKIFFFLIRNRPYRHQAELINKPLNYVYLRRTSQTDNRN